MSTPDEEHRTADQQTIFAEQVRLVYRLGDVGAFAVIVVAWLYVIVVWGAAPRHALLLWATVITAVSAARIGLAAFRRRYAIASHVREWAWGLIALATATGLLWAYAATALFPHEQRELQLIAAFILVGIPAGAVASFGSYTLSYACYLVATILPFSIAFYLRGDDLAEWLVFASLVFMGFLIRVSKWIEATLRDNILKRLQLQRMAEGLARARDAAESADRAKSSFLSNMSHELRTPLNAMVGMNEILLMSNLSADQRHSAEMSRDAALSLLDVVSAVIDMSLLEAGRLDLQESLFDPHHVIGQLERLYRPVAVRKGLEFSVAISPYVPRSLLGDPLRWRQVLSILTDNALKFTERGSVSVVVEALTEPDGSYILRTEVIDTGIGISADERFLLFKPFSQVDASSTRRHGGSGAGLGIAADLARVMGGDIGVGSEKGKGSRFWFSARMKRAGQDHL